MKTPHLRVRKNSDGSARYYWEPSKSVVEMGFRMVRLSDEKARAILEAKERNLEVDEYRHRMARGMFDGARAGTIRALIGMYKGHDDYLLLAEATRRDYASRLELIAKKLGDARVADINPSIVQALKRAFSATPSQANHVCRVFRLLLSFARRQGMIRDNPAMAFRQYREPPRRSVWKHDEEQRFLDVCGPELALVYMLAINTAQRQGDILRLPWSACRDGLILLRQEKTGAEVHIPVTARLGRLLAGTPRVSPVICTRNGRPWRADHFRHMFKAAMVRARVEGRTFHDLRRTAVVRLAEAGCTVPEIASLTGHRIDRTEKIIETYLPRSRRLAQTAITKLELWRPEQE